MLALLRALFALWVTVGMVRIAERGVRVERLLLVCSSRSLDSCGIRHLRIPLPDSSATVTRSEWSCRRSAGTRLPWQSQMCLERQASKLAGASRRRCQVRLDSRRQSALQRALAGVVAILPVQPEVEVMCETQQCAEGAAALRARPSQDTSALSPRTVPERDLERDPARTWPSMELRRLAVPGSGQSPQHAQH